MTSEEQMEHVIHSLIVEKGFVMDNEKNKVLTLKNSTQPDVEYSIFIEMFYILKKSVKFIGEIEI